MKKKKQNRVSLYIYIYIYIYQMMNVAFFYFNMRCKKNGVAGVFNGPEGLHASSKRVNE